MKLWAFDGSWIYFVDGKVRGWVTGFFNEAGDVVGYRAFKDTPESGSLNLGWVVDLEGAKAMLETCVENNASLDNITNR